jgi:PAS domain S-box-containing protein
MSVRKYKTSDVVDGLPVKETGDVPETSGHVMYTSSSDEAEQRNSGESLRVSEERLRSLVQSIPDFIYTVSRDGTVLTINNTRIYHDQDDVVGKKVFDFLSSSHHETVKRALEVVFETGESYTYESTGPGPLGPDSAYYETRVMPLKNDNRVDAAIFISRDITESKKALETLKISEKWYRSFVQNLQGVVYLANPDRSVEFIIGTSMDICGYTMEELNSKKEKWVDLIHPEDRERVCAESLHLGKAKGALTQVYRIITKHGEVKWIEDRKTSLFSKKGEFSGINGIIFDITQRKKAEDEIIFHRNSLEELVKERTKELYQSWERMRLALEATSDGLWDRYIATGEMYFSPGWYKMLGYKPGDFVPSIESWYDLMHHEDIFQVEEKVNSHIRGNNDKYEAKFRLRTKSGDWKWIHSRGRVVEKDDSGKAVRIIGTHIDITQRKEFEDRLRIMERAIGSSINAICITDVECRLAHINDSLVKMWGYNNRNEMLGRDLLEIWGGKYVADTVIQLNERGFVTGEDCGVRKDGSLFQLRFSANLISGEKTKPAYYFFSFIDITETIKIREEITRSRNELHQIFNSTTTGMCIIDLENRITKANNKFLEMFNISAGDINNIFCHNIFDCSDICLLKDFKKRNDPIKHNITVKKDSGSEKVLMVNEVPFYNYAGNVIGILADFTDVTEISLLKMERQAHEDRIIKLTNELIASQEKERQRLAKDLHDSVGQTILAAKINLKECIKNPEESRERFDVGLGFIDQASQELREIYNDLFPSILQDIGLEAAVRQYAKQSLEVNSIECELAFHLKKKPARDIEVNLYRITQELFSNIIKHSGADKVLVELSENDGIVVMEVKDNGSGFDFKEVFKSSCGLGLASIWQRVESMKGKLDVVTSPGNGVQFRITVENRFI